MNRTLYAVAVAVSLFACGVPPAEQMGSGGGTAQMNGTPTYSLGFQETQTGWTGAPVATQFTTYGKCPAGFVATSLTGDFSSSSTSGYSIQRLALNCVQLKPTGLGTVGSAASPIGIGSGGKTATSGCAAGSLAVGLVYLGGTYTDGVAAVCAPFAEWVDLSKSPATSTSTTFIGNPNASTSLSCPQGSALTGLEGYDNDYEIRSFRGECIAISVSLQ